MNLVWNNLKKKGIEAKERREVLLQEMSDLNQRLINCEKCSGHCCTFQKNSMQITPLEALEILSFLKEAGHWGPEIVEKMKSCIQEFRLDNPLIINKKGPLRRSYTCPFFQHKSLGCFLPPSVKPYGCLGFNPQRKGEGTGDSCRSRFETLKVREESFEAFESIQNTKIRKEGNLYWEKETIPIALLTLAAAMA